MLSKTQCWSFLGQVQWSVLKGEVQVKVLVAQMCPTLCDPTDCSPPGSSVHGILQARILVWDAMPSSRGPSPPSDRTRVSCITGRFFIIWATKEALWKGTCSQIYLVPTSVLISPNSGCVLFPCQLWGSEFLLNTSREWFIVSCSSGYLKPHFSSCPHLSRHPLHPHALFPRCKILVWSSPSC